MRVGTIGSGVIVSNFLDGVKEIEGAACEAVYSRSLQKGQELAHKFGVKKVYTELVDMMKDPEVDTVYVASPNSLHYEHTKIALEHGKNVICEKPFTTTFDKAKELAGLAKEKGAFLFDAVPPSFLPNFKALKEQLPAIGRIRLIMTNYSQYSSRYDSLLEGKITNVFSKDFAGGSLQDIGFYNLYFNVAMFGKPVGSHYYPNMYPGQVDTSGVLILQYEDFVSSNVGAKDTWGINYAQIEGEKGYIYVTGGSNGFAELKVVTKQEERIVNLQEPVSRFIYEVKEITRIIEEKDYEECYRRLDVALDVIETLEKARKAAGIYFSDEQA